MSEVIQKAKNITRSYFEGRIRTDVLKGVNLAIRQDELTAIIGKSGSGKSTLLHILGTLDTPTSGEILFKGDDLCRLSGNKKAQFRNQNLGFVYQFHHLLGDFTALENVMMPLLIGNMDIKKAKATASEYLEKVGLSHRIGYRPSEMSGGERQRVAIGRAIVRNPKVLLMDEPLSNLDAKLRNQMRAEIIKLRKRIKTTFIYVTHDQTEAMTLGDRIVIMKDGVIQQVGKPQEVYDNPYNLFVAGFIGVPAMNQYNGKLLCDKDTYSVQVGDVIMPLSKEKSANLARNHVTEQDVIVGVRPEHITLEGDPAKMIHGTVDVSEMMGSAIHLHVNALGKDSVIIVPTIDLQAGNDYSMGSDIQFTFSSHAIHVFDPVSTLNLEYNK